MAQEDAGEHGKQRSSKATAEPISQTQSKPANGSHPLSSIAAEVNGHPMASKAATAAAIALGAALIEVEWIPGILIGAAAVLAPDLLPKFGRGLRPVVKGLVKAGYSLTERARETMAEAGEQMQDIVAEVRAEQHMRPASEPRPEHSAAAQPD